MTKVCEIDKKNYNQQRFQANKTLRKGRIKAWGLSQDHGRNRLIIYN